MVRRSIRALVLMTIAAAAANATTVFNGGFETGDLTGWTLTNASGFDTVCLEGDTIGAATCVAHSGDYAMSFGHWGAITTLSQVVATTPGAAYALDFYLANDNPGNSGVTTFDVMWDGVDVYSLSSPQPSFSYTLVNLYVTASSSSTTLSFVAQQDPSQWFLDDVSAEAVSEPATMLTAAFALIAAGLARRRLAARSATESKALAGRRKAAA